MLMFIRRNNGNVKDTKITQRVGKMTDKGYVNVERSLWSVSVWG